MTDSLAECPRCGALVRVSTVRYFDTPMGDELDVDCTDLLPTLVAHVQGVRSDLGCDQCKGKDPAPTVH